MFVSIVVLDQWSPYTVNVCENPLEGLLKLRPLDLSSRLSGLSGMGLGPRICLFSMFPSYAYPTLMDTL
jgi:hypothetical protein